MESLLLVSDTLEAIGAVTVAYMVIRVHQHVAKEHRLDARVYTAMRRERIIGFLAICFIATGYLLRLYTHFIAY